MSPHPRHASRGTTRATPIGAKATTPTSASRERARTNSGQISHERSRRVLTPADRWAAAVDGVIERFKADMAIRYADEPSRDETNNGDVTPAVKTGTKTAQRRNQTAKRGHAT